MKRDIIAEVMSKIKQKGGRFVRIKDNVWSIVPDKVSRLKVAHAIQYHIRTEFAQSKEVSFSTVEDTMYLDSIPEEQLSDHDRVVRAIREKVSMLQSQPTEPSELPQSSNHNTLNHLILSNTNTNVHLIESSNTEESVGQVEMSSTQGVVHRVVPPLVQENVTEFDHLLNDRQFNEFSQHYRRIQTALPQSNTPVWMKHSHSDDYSVFPQQMPEVNAETKELKNSLARSRQSIHRRSTLPFSGRKNEMVAMLPKIVNTSPEEKRSPHRYNPIPSNTSAPSLEHGSHDKNNSWRGAFVDTAYVNDMQGTPTDSFERSESSNNVHAIDCHKISPSNEVECVFSGIGMLDGLPAFSGHDGSIDLPIRNRMSTNQYSGKMNGTIRATPEFARDDDDFTFL